jgi:hypothetical protein
MAYSVNRKTCHHVSQAWPLPWPYEAPAGVNAHAGRPPVSLMESGGLPSPGWQPRWIRPTHFACIRGRIADCKDGVFDELKCRMLLWRESGTCRDGRKKVLTQMYANKCKCTQIDPCWPGFPSETLASPWLYKCLRQSEIGHWRLRPMLVLPLTYLRSFALKTFFFANAVPQQSADPGRSRHVCAAASPPRIVAQQYPATQALHVGSVSPPLPAPPPQGEWVNSKPVAARTNRWPSPAQTQIAMA